ncbi:MAG TPA: hypothetical protein P5098_02585 [Candidatus Dojkabacteria bacterium]|nr:hypothetical protein [Candidatus Dojkabacteria bacterium]
MRSENLLTFFGAVFIVGIVGLFTVSTFVGVLATIIFGYTFFRMAGEDE